MVDLLATRLLLDVEVGGEQVTELSLLDRLGQLGCFKCGVAALIIGKVVFHFLFCHLLL